MASILATATPDAPAPAQASAAQAIGEGGSGELGAGFAPVEGNSAPANNEGKGASGNTPNEAGNAAEGATEASTADVPELTKSLAPETGVSAEKTGTVYYGTTQTIHLQSTEALNATNGSMSVKTLNLASESRAEPSPTKKSEGATAVERLVGLMAGALFCVMAVMTLL
jgi:hypothetical protein